MIGGLPGFGAVLVRVKEDIAGAGDGGDGYLVDLIMLDVVFLYHLEGGAEVGCG